MTGVAGGRECNIIKSRGGGEREKAIVHDICS